MRQHKGTTKHKGQERMVMGWTLKPCTHDERQNIEHEFSNHDSRQSETVKLENLNQKVLLPWKL